MSNFSIKTMYFYIFFAVLYGIINKKRNGVIYYAYFNTSYGLELMEYIR